MNKSKAINVNVQKGNTFNFFQPADAWGTIFVFVFVVVVLLAVKSTGSKALNILYPLGTFVVAWRLYFRHPILYVGFVWWVFFLTAFIRRFADFNGGAFTDPSPMLLAPYTAVIVCSHTLYFNLSKSREQGSAPFVMAIVAIIYGYLVGLINGASPVTATVALLEWISPLLFGYHLFVNWNRYPEYCRNLQKVFLWGVLIMGIYGVYQFMVAPEWDRFWLENSPIKTSAGKPEPLGIRVWSTLNAPGPFASFMATGLLILFRCQSVLVLPAAGFGALSFLLSMVRTAWLGWSLGMITIITSIKPKQQLKLVLTILVLALIVIPLATIEPFASSISERLTTLVDVKNDPSFQARQFIYENLFNDALTSYIGSGLGINLGQDSAFLVMMFDLGWIGAIPYVGGLIVLIISIFRTSTKTKDIFDSIIRAIVLQSIFYLFAGPSMKGATGMLLWPFIAMALAGRKYNNYYESQLALGSKSTKSNYNQQY
ncbi:MAG: glucose-6-phosphate isomerase [Pseudanabaena frigida]|uniref:Glucose-6-phosphate isomerase n=1 Tax=Pseudanabaena frigida TaxID=945775 RepID=A0A2W4WIV1_9CYAN|nr:MAG: glucose-6-phosphate isomerase [Pseudanabaena frigida]